MAHKLLLPHKPHGMPYLWNVDAHVGELASCSNRPTDVELVQFLIIGSLTFLNQKTARAGGVLKQTQTSLRPSGQMDAVTAYWLLSSQVTTKGVNGQAVVDGFVSPAKLGADLCTWWIGRVNLAIFNANRYAWETLGQSVTMSAGLKRELTR